MRSGVLALGLLSVACSDAPKDEQSTPHAPAFDAGAVTPEIVEGDCLVPFPSPARCGVLKVALNRSTPDGGTVVVPFMVLRATGPDPAPDPYVWIPGGPGDAALTTATVGSYATPDRAPVLERRDVVLFDVRGTGHATPSLRCPELDATVIPNYALPIEPSEEVAATVTAARACHDRLTSQNIDLGAFGSNDVAADVHDLVTALGYRAFNVRGTSYGARYALTLLRNHPEGIRSVILDSVVPPDVNFLSELPGAAERAFKTLDAGCRANDGCASAFPGLRDGLRSTAERLDRAPVTLHPKDPSGATFPLVLNGWRYLTGIREALRDTSLIPAIPLVASNAAAGDLGLVEASAGSLAVPSDSAAGAFYGAHCKDVPTGATSLFPASPAEMTDAFAMGWAELQQICAFWGAKHAGAEDAAPVVSDVPVLILEGEYDPVTPAAYGEHVAQSLSRSTLVVVPGVGHSVLFAPTAEGARPRCALKIGLSFLEDPTAVPDTSCASQVPGPAFLTP